MNQNKRQKQNILLILALAVVGIYALSYFNYGYDQINYWISLIPESVKFPVLMLFVIGVFAVPIFIIATVISRIGEYRAKKVQEAGKDDTGTYYELKAKKTKQTFFIFLAIIGVVLTIVFLTEAMKSGTYSLLIIPLILFVISGYNLLAIYKEKGITVDGNTITICYTFKKPFIFKISDIVSVRRIYAEGQELRDSFTITTRFGPKSIAILSQNRWYEHIRERLEVESPHLCFWEIKEKVIYCAGCGLEMRSDEKYCSRCRRAADNTEPSASAQTIQQPPPMPPPMSDSAPPPMPPPIAVQVPQQQASTVIPLPVRNQTAKKPRIIPIPPKKPAQQVSASQTDQK